MATITRIGALHFMHHGDEGGHVEVQFDLFDDVTNLVISHGRFQADVPAGSSDAVVLLSLARDLVAAQMPKASPENLTIAFEAAKRAEAEAKAAEARVEQAKAEIADLDQQIEAKKAEAARPREGGK